jgi:hypothetical protein
VQVLDRTAAVVVGIADGNHPVAHPDEAFADACRTVDVLFVQLADVVNDLAVRRAAARHNLLVARAVGAVEKLRLVENRQAGRIAGESLL